jgi:adenosylmethionine-8-amino-7-oxononanoate aminotransferase
VSDMAATAGAISLDRDGYAGWHGTMPMKQYLESVSYDMCLVEGRGARVRDAAGRWYLDSKAGLWNVTLGYDHPVVIEAIERQLRALPYACLIRDDHPPAIAIEFANALAARMPEGLRRVRFGSTGSQMAEAAVLLSRCVRAAEGDRERSEIIALGHAYHGSGPGAWALTDAPVNRELCGPLLPGVHRVASPAEGVDAAVAELSSRIDAIGAGRVTAVILEPIQGDRVAAPSRDYLLALRDLTERHAIHLIFDEVATGMGRTGAITVTDETGVLPDMLVLGKGLSSGYLPAGALVVSEPLYDLLYDAPRVPVAGGVEAPVTFLHGSTADGGPLAMAAGLAVLEVLFEHGVLEDVRRVGGRLGGLLAELVERNPHVARTGGAGLMHGITLVDPDGSPWPLPRMQTLRRACAGDGLLIQVLGNRIVFVPPLIVDEADCEEMVEKVDAAIAAVAAAAAVAGAG